ncbi:ABC transporter ATP-binding protein [Imtechella halotolerans]|uniref:ABC transporter ATP-binding protein n=1 Tax=Imtechella halotolerans TaxID=1165090 RepID=UPI00059010CB|nr:ABC transporter ATP-binding protein [Imtechella halotolerans]
MKDQTRHSVLSTDSLSIGYRTKREELFLADDVTFDLFKGELVALVGANGIGKSTLLRTLAGIQPALKGSISIDNRPLENYPPEHLATVLSLVLTEPIAAKSLTVVEVIALGRQPYTNWLGTLNPSDIHKVKEVVQQLQLSDIQHKKCYELSDGQLQKVMIARALAQDTSLIILDEPTTHLDIYHKAYILKLLKKIAHETQKTILFSSHEMDLAIQLCDKMMVLANKKVMVDTPCNLIEKGSFQSIFPKEIIEFDSKTGVFRIK